MNANSKAKRVYIAFKDNTTSTCCQTQDMYTRFPIPRPINLRQVVAAVLASISLRLASLRPTTPAMVVPWWCWPFPVWLPPCSSHFHNIWNGGFDKRRGLKDFPDILIAATFSLLQNLNYVCQSMRNNSDELPRYSTFDLWLKFVSGIESVIENNFPRTGFEMWISVSRKWPLNQLSHNHCPSRLTSQQCDQIIRNYAKVDNILIVFGNCLTFYLIFGKILSYVVWTFVICYWVHFHCYNLVKIENYYTVSL